MRWRSGAFAFDTRGLPYPSYIQAPEEQQRLKAHIMPQRPVLELHFLRNLILFIHCFGTSPLCSGPSAQALRADGPFATSVRGTERRLYDALEERSVRL
ncbi:hypothetical protein [Paenibacillus silvae]|uniref:hypothetical protein n=1 Tax=Paenibacillus silvae TaxID=1325358 RepID=UPI00200331D4|nr:hypothetical protein [Paenibacillus silvae]MCK6078438.1 hypothetical protein [Paenibacillus silvae]MCK6152673.1 hypothetical protein [Paenibacillus silvae]MCK6271151.1 hypothetical protein [Paenibacillus silvae]